MFPRIAAVLILGSTLAAAPVRTAQTAQPPAQAKDQVSSSTEKFLKDVLDDDFWEVEMAKLTQSNSNDERVQSFGECLQTDHEKAIQDLRALMISKGIEAREKISSGRMRIVDDRQQVVGVPFDKAYVAEMVRAHEAAIAEFKKHQDESDPDVKQFVAKTLSVLQDHLDKATALKKEIERGSTAVDQRG